jgi:hypothetical protein
MISDGCAYANRKVVVQGVGEHLLPTAQAWRLGWPGPTIAAPGTRNRHVDLSCYLVPSQALVTQFQDLLCRRGMRTSTATHGDAGPTKLIAHGGPGNPQLGTDLAQSTTLGVQVGCTLYVHERHSRVAVRHLLARVAEESGDACNEESGRRSVI